MSDQPKQIVFRVVPNGPSNMTNHIPLCYFHSIRKKFLYLDRYHNVQVADEIGKNTNIEMLTIDSVNNGYTLSYSEADADYKKKQETVQFFKEWPFVGKSMPSGAVDSYPSENHKRHFAQFYKTAPNEALQQSVQGLRYIDEVEQNLLSAKEKRNKMQISTSLNAVAKDLKKMQSICYLLGINPYGLLEDELFNVLYDSVIDGEKGGRFLEIVSESKWDNRLILAVETARVLGIISIDDNGVFQFLGDPFTKDPKSIPYYFKSSKANFINLIDELSKQGQDFSDLYFDDEAGEVVSKLASDKGKGKGGSKAPKAEPITTTSEEA